MNITNEDILAARLKDEFYVTVDTLDEIIKELRDTNYLLCSIKVNQKKRKLFTSYVVNKSFTLLNGYGCGGILEFNKGEGIKFWVSRVSEAVRFWHYVYKDSEETIWK